MIYIVPYERERHRGGIRGILAKNVWEERYIAGQLTALDVLSGDPGPGTRGKVYVAEPEGLLEGFVSVELREWNRLGQLHGLAVEPDFKRRGIYADTPETNEVARTFFRALGYRLAYAMPEYYDEGLDGVTYLKLFPR